MNEQEKTKKLEMLPWQALFDLAISKEIDENDIKGKEKSTIIFKIIHEATMRKTKSLQNGFCLTLFLVWTLQKVPCMKFQST